MYQYRSTWQTAVEERIHNNYILMIIPTYLPSLFIVTSHWKWTWVVLDSGKSQPAIGQSQTCYPSSDGQMSRLMYMSMLVFVDAHSVMNMTGQCGISIASGKPSSKVDCLYSSYILYFRLNFDCKKCEFQVIPLISLLSCQLAQSCITCMSYRLHYTTVVYDLSYYSSRPMKCVVGDLMWYKNNNLAISEISLFR